MICLRQQLLYPWLVETDGIKRELVGFDENHIFFDLFTLMIQLLFDTKMPFDYGVVLHP